MIVQRFRFTIVPNSRVDHKVQGIVLGPKQPVHMQIVPQDRQFGSPPSVKETIHELVKLR